MSILAAALIVLVGLEHVWFLVLEMFLWTQPIGLKTFRNSEEKAAIMAVMAKNQGLYNGFLAAGLFWSVLPGHPEARALQTFFLACVVVAGIYGGITVNRRIAMVQAIPAAVALAAVWLTGS